MHVHLRPLNIIIVNRTQKGNIKIEILCDSIESLYIC